MAFTEREIGLIFEHTKHIGTMASGAILLLVSFYEKFGAARDWGWLVPSALVLLVISLLGALGSQIGAIGLHVSGSSCASCLTGVVLILTYLSFFLAFLALSAYGVKNSWSGAPDVVGLLVGPARRGP